jgi:hypothetical protein
MPPRRPAPPEEVDASVSYQLGQISGQLRELVHGIANLQQSVTALGVRVASLEASENRRDGASSVLRTVLKSPAIGWLVGAAVTAWALLTGRLHP